MNPIILTSIRKVIISLLCCIVLLTDTSTLFAQNYIRRRTPRDYFTTDAALDAATANAAKVQSAYQYFDGLGRPLQTVTVKGNPDATKDIIQPFAYDQFGRETRKFLPYSIVNTSGTYRPDALVGTNGYSNSAQKLFYSNSGLGYKETTTPYADVITEASPLNRMYEQGAPGDTWQPGTRTATGGRTAVTEYGTNNQVVFPATLTGNAGSQRVVYYYVDASGNLSRGTGVNEYFANGQLYLTTTKDENWDAADGCFGITEEYKNKEGQVILKRTYNRAAAAQMLSTYYVYDDQGNLRFILPPGSLPDAAKPVNDYLNNFCFQYKYDDRNHQVQKRIPGKGWEFMIYNKLDQVVMTQDPLQRNKAPQEWSITKYDMYGRIVITGIYQDAGTTADNNANTPSLTRLTALQSSVTNQTGTLWETRNSAGTEGYTIAAFPLTWYASLIINYYDDYSGIPNVPATFATPANASTMTKGLLTCTRTNVLGLTGAANTLYSFNFYDNDGRVTTTYKQHYYSGAVSNNNYDKITNTYNFNDQLTTATRQHYINVSGSPVLKVTVADQHIYDHVGRKIKSWQTLTGTPRTLLSSVVYNEVGQLRTKYLHITDTVTNNFKQQIDYAYNERGWLKTINKDAVTSPTATKVFGMELYYQDAVNKQYNGNIGSIDWHTKVPTGSGLYDQIQKYGYTYDDIDRLTLAQYNPGLTNQDKFNEEISYDVMSNIGTLKRKNSTTAGAYLNNLSYNYSSTSIGNRLWSVTDGTTPYTYTYDVNGNVLTDTRNQITNISYNLLNLPQTITRTPGNMTYTYDAEGEKLKKVSGGITREYIDGIEYNNGTLEFVATEEGRAIPVGAAYSYEYYLKDHLGNTRAGFKQDGSITQVQDYYAYGLIMNPGNAYSSSPINNYKYNGKEKQEETGQYDYGARFYDPVIARWTSVDPSADDEDQEIDSPYGYVANNPISRVDPDGKFWNIIVGAVVGAGVDYTFQVIGNYASGKRGVEAFTDIKWKSVAISGAAGALTSGSSAFIAKTALSPVAKSAVKELVGTAIDAGESILKQRTDPENKNGVTLSKTLSDVVSNKVAGAVTKGVEKKLNIGATVRHLDRAQRVAGRLPRAGRALAVKKLKMELNAKNGTQQAVTGYVGNAVQTASDWLRSITGGQVNTTQPSETVQRDNTKTN
jgi:RHS repeat-associated protein